MSTENRKARRRFVRQPALILNGDGSVFGSCKMMDVSATGAKLELQTPSAVPDEFTLLLSKYGNVRRGCKISWRSETALGVRFVVAERKSVA
jgi:hypothetical protein